MMVKYYYIGIMRLKKTSLDDKTRKMPISLQQLNVLINIKIIVLDIVINDTHWSKRLTKLF